GARNGRDRHTHPVGVTRVAIRFVSTSSAMTAATPSPAETSSRGCMSRTTALQPTSRVVMRYSLRQAHCGAGGADRRCSLDGADHLGVRIVAVAYTSVTRDADRILHGRSRRVSRRKDTMRPVLRYKTLVTRQVKQVGRGPLPDGSPRMWSPITSTLIMGKHDAVLVDPPLTVEQADEVGDWVAASGRNLTQIYITHGHGDHWFGALSTLERFPGVTVRATEGTAK